MLDRETIVKRLREHEAALRARGVSALYLFGSVARGEAGPASDVDLFFDYDNPSLSLLDVIGIEQYLADQLEAKVDAMTRGSLHPLLKRSIERSAVQVF